MSFLELKKINKTFGNEGRKITVLSDLDLSVEKGERIAIMGKSGCGKTTLMNILAGIDAQDSGEYLLDETPIKITNAAQGVKFRRNRIGVVLQHFALINDMTVYENIEMGLWEVSISRREMKSRVTSIMRKLGLEGLKDKYPPTLSGGEKQRVAIGRAIINNPILLLADEPTGSLDADTERSIIELLSELNRETGTTLIIVTHDEEVARHCDRTIHLEKH